jgi:hypothetical protein
MRDDSYLDTLEDRLEKQQSDIPLERRYYNALMQRCIEIQSVSKEELLSLADKRADVIIEYLTKEQFIKPTRLERLEATSSDADEMIKVQMKIEVK